MRTSVEVTTTTMNNHYGYPMASNRRANPAGPLYFAQVEALRENVNFQYPVNILTLVAELH